MNDALGRLARDIALDDAGHERLRLAFSHACAQRVSHLLEDPGVIACLHAASIDGCGQAAVSATYAVANALAGKPRQAAADAAYATV